MPQIPFDYLIAKHPSLAAKHDAAQSMIEHQWVIDSTDSDPITETGDIP